MPGTGEQDVELVFGAQGMGGLRLVWAMGCPLHGGTGPSEAAPGSWVAVGRGLELSVPPTRTTALCSTVTEPGG